MIKKLYKKAIELIYPKSCPLCGDIIKEYEQICPECRCTLSYVESPSCLKCGCEIDGEEEEYCHNCAKRERTFIKGYPALNYVGPIRESLAQFKYHGMKSYSEFYADEIAKRHGDELKQLEIDALVPVPVHRKKLLKRGYNQAELLANDLGRILDIPVDSDLLLRNINTLPQKKLNDVEREINIKKAFISRDKIVKYNSVVLVDDIYTTGATIEACTRVLREKGIKNIYYTSVCVGRR